MAHLHSLTRSLSRIGRYATLVRQSSTAVALNPAVLNIKGSGIREIMTKGTAMDKENQTSPVIHLEVGQPNFATPQHVVDATVLALREGHTNYNPNNGLLSLRESIVRNYTRRGFPTSVDQIVVTVGSSLSLFSLLVTLLKPGDECLLPIPGFPNYQAAIAMTGGVSVPYLCHPKQGFLPTLEGIASRCSPRTRCLILCNPGNPTGATYPAPLLKEILLWAHARDIFVISDEIYSDIVFDAPHRSAAALEAIHGVNAEQLAIVSGVSKGYAMTGYRVGWTRCSPYVAAQLTKIQEPLVSCASPFNQLAAAAALDGPQDCVERMRGEYRLRRDTALEILKCRGRESSYVPGGAFYLPVDISSSGLSSRNFALRLLEEKRCAIAPGSAFNTFDPLPSTASGSTFENQCALREESLQMLESFCRVSLANSTENVVKGMNLICDMLDELQAQCKR